jgi:hypothetical protein
MEAPGGVEPPTNGLGKGPENQVGLFSIPCDCGRLYQFVGIGAVFLLVWQLVWRLVRCLVAGGFPHSLPHANLSALAP